MSNENAKDDLFAHLDKDPWEENTVESPHAMIGRFGNAQDALTYILSGKGTITVRSVKTGTRFTYRLRLKEGDNPGTRGHVVFVSLLTGQDNNTSYSYLGQFFTNQQVYFHGRKSKIGHDAPAAKAFDWVFKQLTRKQLPTQLEVWHEGICGRCGRKLTVPESVKQGFGPECVQRI